MKWNSKPAYRALIVEDEVVVRRATISAVSRLGFQCDAASNGAEAAKLTEQVDYDLVVTDLRMPHGNGHALCVDLLSRPKRPAVIVITGVVEPRLQADLRRRGVDEVIFKPVDYQHIADRAKYLVDRRGASPAAAPGAAEDQNETSAVPQPSDRAAAGEPSIAGRQSVANGLSPAPAPSMANSSTSENASVTSYAPSRNGANSAGDTQAAPSGRSIGQEEPSPADFRRSSGQASLGNPEAGAQRASSGQIAAKQLADQVAQASPRAPHTEIPGGRPEPINRKGLSAPVANGAARVSPATLSPAQLSGATPSSAPANSSTHASASSSINSSIDPASDAPLTNDLEMELDEDGKNVASDVSRLQLLMPVPPPDFDGFKVASANSFTAEDLVQAIQRSPQFALQVLKLVNYMLYNADRDNQEAADELLQSQHAGLMASLLAPTSLAMFGAGSLVGSIVSWLLVSAIAR